MPAQWLASGGAEEHPVAEEVTEAEDGLVAEGPDTAHVGKSAEAMGERAGSLGGIGEDWGGLGHALNSNNEIRSLE